MFKQVSLCGCAVATALALTTTISPHAQQPVASSAQQPVAPTPEVLAPLPMPEILKQYQPVSAERLKNPVDGEWPMIRRTYDGWGYSPLSQIDSGNVGRLVPVWGFSTGVTNGHESAPLVVNGVMFVSTPGNQVLAINARTGTLLWRYRRPLPSPVVLNHPTSRGVAIYNDKVYFAAGEAVLVALDAKTGEEAWTTRVADNASGYYMSLAPLVADGKVLIGTSGGDLGIRGFVAAFDAETGTERWRTFMVPAPGEPGSETWPTGDEWKRGGASVWVSANYDPATNFRSGARATADRGWVIGVPATTCTWPPPLPSMSRPVKSRGICNTAPTNRGTGMRSPLRSSWTSSAMDARSRGSSTWRATATCIFWSEQPARSTSWTGLHSCGRTCSIARPQDGPPRCRPRQEAGHRQTSRFLPVPLGRQELAPHRVQSEDANDIHPGQRKPVRTYIGREVEYVPAAATPANRHEYQYPGSKHIGEVQAWNVDTGKRSWTHTFAKSANWGPILTTAGGLVFSGGTNDRMFRAFDAKSGRVLWEHPTNSGIIGVPISFSIDGRQYVAVQSGFGIDARAMQGRLNRLNPGEYPEVPEGGAVWVFALK